MMIFWMILAVLLGVILVVAWNNCSSATPSIMCVLGIVASLFFAYTCHWNQLSNAEVKAYSNAGIECLSKEEVYNTSQAELDKLYKVSNLDGTYYYRIETK